MEMEGINTQRCKLNTTHSIPVCELPVKSIGYKPSQFQGMPSLVNGSINSHASHLKTVVI
ncbi:hypothetical protein DPMN_115903 [Dreissena polymorpha]|uniref:Uncharacterized protein n=1 Tax=Dreissena polymorpha TaxID=45954 RepID=A0A9D4KM23_DREPO|nr:hypothetical protein DPMN_115903 [Dreissena polymorpha]